MQMWSVSRCRGTSPFRTTPLFHYAKKYVTVNQVSIAALNTHKSKNNNSTSHGSSQKECDVRMHALSHIHTDTLVTSHHSPNFHGSTVNVCWNISIHNVCYIKYFFSKQSLIILSYFIIRNCSLVRRDTKCSRAPSQKSLTAPHT